MNFPHGLLQNEMLRQVSDRRLRRIVDTSSGGHAAGLCTHRKGMIILFLRRQIPMLGSTRDAAGCALNCRGQLAKEVEVVGKQVAKGRRHVSERLVNLVGATVVSHRIQNFCPTSRAPYLSNPCIAHATRMVSCFYFKLFFQI